jgi:hypothetical protein
LISSLSPGAAAAGTQVTISGAYFGAGLTLSVGGLAVVPDSVTGTDVVFTSPAGVPCDTTVVITNPDGQNDSSGFNGTPVITNTFLDSGPAAGGANFIIIGQYFAPGMTVTMWGNTATITSQNPSSLQVTTPAGTTGVANVVVTSPAGCSATTTYTYL